MALVITVNGAKHTVQASPDTPLLYVLRNELLLQGPHFGCGLSQCGACAVLADNQQIRSCVTPVIGVKGQQIVTLEGLPALYSQQHKKTVALHPLQDAWIEEQVPQ
ncbi:MAG: (2Fe-2S)-binding protein, partial [Chloroflexota bacterium]